MVRRSFFLSVLFIWFSAFFLRAVHLLQVKDVLLFTHLVGDARFHDAWAQKIAQGNWIGTGVFYHAPLYPYFLAVLYAALGHNLLAVRGVQILLGATSCVFLAMAGRFFFSPWTGVLAGVLLAFYPTMIFFEGLLQKVVLEVFFLTLLLLLLGKITCGPRARLWFATGVVLGGLSLARESGPLFIPILAVWVLLQFQDNPWKKRWQWLAAFGMGLAFVLLPVGLRNLVVGGEFHVISSQSGPNFYLGNNKKADGLYKPLRWARGQSESEHQDAIDLAEEALGRKLTPSEVSRYWSERTLAEIREDPGHWFNLLWRKWRMVWNSTEISDTEDQYTYSKWSAVLRILGLFFHFGVVVPLAAFGLYVTWPQRRRLWLLYTMVFGIAAGLVLFLVYSRYRLPMVPFLLLFAAAGLREGIVRCRRKQFKTLWVGGAIVLFSALAANWPIVSRQNMGAVTYYNMGVAQIEEGSFEEALRSLTEAQRLDPTDAMIRNNLGYAFKRLGRHEEALAAFAEAVRLKPDYATYQLNCGLACLDLKKMEEAVKYLTEAVRLKPNDPVYHYGLGVALLKQNRTQEAVVHLREAVRLNPDFLEARRILESLPSD